MTLEEFRERMRAYWDAVYREAISLKDSQSALEQMCECYRNLDEPERTLANAVLAEWVLDSDELLRFVALGLIDMFQIHSAVKSLHRLTERLTGSREPGAPYELNKVNRLLSSLAS